MGFFSRADFIILIALVGILIFGFIWNYETTTDCVIEKISFDYINISDVNYEFCIPNDNETLSNIYSVDSNITCSSGASNCTETDLLCTGSTVNKNTQDVLCKLSLIASISSITQSFR